FDAIDFHCSHVKPKKIGYVWRSASFFNAEVMDGEMITDNHAEFVPVPVLGRGAAPMNDHFIGRQARVLMDELWQRGAMSKKILVGMHLYTALVQRAVYQGVPHRLFNSGIRFHLGLPDMKRTDLPAVDEIGRIIGITDGRGIPFLRMEVYGTGVVMPSKRNDIREYVIQCRTRVLGQFMLFDDLSIQYKYVIFKRSVCCWK